MPQGFTVIRRNYGHWDIATKGERAFRLRGGPGDWRVYDERSKTRPYHRPVNDVRFRDQAAAMAWICAELMHELLIAEGQDFHVIEGWNVTTDDSKEAGQ